MTWVLDLDGVLWLSERPIAGAAEAVVRLRAAGHQLHPSGRQRLDHPRPAAHENRRAGFEHGGRRHGRGDDGPLGVDAYRRQL